MPPLKYTLSLKQEAKLKTFQIGHKRKVGTKVFQCGKPISGNKTHCLKCIPTREDNNE